MVLEGLTHARVAPLLRTKPSRDPAVWVSETLRKGSRSNIFAKRRKNWSKCYILAMFGGSLSNFFGRRTQFAEGHRVDCASVAATPGADNGIRRDATASVCIFKKEALYS